MIETRAEGRESDRRKIHVLYLRRISETLKTCGRSSASLICKDVNERSTKKCCEKLVIAPFDGFRNFSFGCLGVKVTRLEQWAEDHNPQTQTQNQLGPVQTWD